MCNCLSPTGASVVSGAFLRPSLSIMPFLLPTSDQGTQPGIFTREREREETRGEMEGGYLYTVFSGAVGHGRQMSTSR